MPNTDSSGYQTLTWPNGRSIQVSEIEKVEAVEAIMAIMRRYHPLDALVIFKAIGELVDEGDITDGATFVLALRESLE